MLDYKPKKSREYKPRTIEDVRKQQEDYSNREGFIQSDVQFFRAHKDKENQIRIMEPTWEKFDNFGFSVWVHYSIGLNGAAYLCLNKMLKQPCPVCEEAKRASEEGDKKYAKKLWPKHRVVSYVIDRHQEEKGPLVWPMPFNVSREINSKCVGRVTQTVIQIDHPTDGRDIFFDCPPFTAGDGSQAFKYENITLGEVATPLHSKEDKAEEWLDFIYDNPLPELLVTYDYEHVANELNAGMGGFPSPKSSSQREPEQRSSDSEKQESPEEQKQQVESGENAESEDLPFDPDKENPKDDDEEDLSPRERRRRRLAKLEEEQNE